MNIIEKEKQKILEYAKFLENRGYTKYIRDNTIVYSDKAINFIITFEPYSDASDISIKFIKENEIYSIGWIACVRSNLDINPHERLDNVLKLLVYIKENYSELIKINYCQESNKLVDEFVAEKRKNN